MSDILTDLSTLPERNNAGRLSELCDIQYSLGRRIDPVTVANHHRTTRVRTAETISPTPLMQVSTQLNENLFSLCKCKNKEYKSTKKIKTHMKFKVKK